MRAVPPQRHEARLEAAGRSYGRCVGCGDQARDVHHVFIVQRFPELRDDPDGMVAVCRPCHSGHHSRMHPLSFSSLPACVHGLAETIGPHAIDYLTRTYPGRTGA